MIKSKASGLVQFIKFAVVGVGNTAVDWIIYYILTATVLSGDKSLAKAISFLVAVANSYLWNTIWTFKREYQELAKSEQQNAKSLIVIKFLIVSLIGWGINWFAFRYVLAVFDPTVLGKQDIMPLIAASSAAIIWNFFANKLWTYRK